MLLHCTHMYVSEISCHLIMKLHMQNNSVLKTLHQSGALKSTQRGFVFVCLCLIDVQCVTQSEYLKIVQIGTHFENLRLKTVSRQTDRVICFHALPAVQWCVAVCVWWRSAVFFSSAFKENLVVKKKLRKKTSPAVECSKRMSPVQLESSWTGKPAFMGKLNKRADMSQSKTHNVKINSPKTNLHNIICT